MDDGSATTATVGSANTFLTGIDVSHHQGAVDWQQVAGAGITFAFAKASQGASFVDNRFQTNWAAMKAAGVARGAYHFLSPSEPAVTQVHTFCTTVGALDAGDLPPVLDVEEDMSDGRDRWLNVPPTARTPLILSWLQGVSMTLKRRPILYLRRGFVADKLPAPAPLTAFPIWVADYSGGPVPRLPSGWTTWKFWQQSESGTVAGVTGAVDRNLYNGSLASLRDWVQTTLL